MVRIFSRLIMFETPHDGGSAVKEENVQNIVYYIHYWETPGIQYFIFT